MHRPHRRHGRVVNSSSDLRLNIRISDAEAQESVRESDLCRVLIETLNIETPQFNPMVGNRRTVQGRSPWQIRRKTLPRQIIHQRGAASLARLRLCRLVRRRFYLALHKRSRWAFPCMESARALHLMNGVT